MESKTVVLVAIAVLSFISGAVVQYTHRRDSLLQPLFLLIGAFLIFLWYYRDTEERGFRRTPLLNIGVIAVAIVALPYYFFRSRGVKGGFFALGLFILVLIGSGVLTVTGQYATHYFLSH